jgi:hypothetical protein
MIQMRKRLSSDNLLRSAHAHFAVSFHQHSLCANREGNLRVVRGHQDGNACTVQLFERLQ